MSQSDFLSSPEALRCPLGTIHVSELEDDRDGGDWITRLLSSGLFRHLPPENSQRFFAELEGTSVRAGEVVAEQGAQGDHFYVVTLGRCAVTRKAPGSEREIQLGVLKEGDTFGEGALISGTPRTTTVRMLNDGALMRLQRQSFEQLVLIPTLKVLSYPQACGVINDGGAWLDVRPNAEHEGCAFDGSIGVPSHLLSLKHADLDRTRSYVAYCESGALSAASAFFLLRSGFDAYVLEGGLERMDPKTDATQIFDSAEPAALPSVPSGDAFESPAVGESAQIAGQAPDPASDTLSTDLLQSLSERNNALQRLTEAHDARHHELARQLAEVRRDADQELQTQRRRLARRYKKMRRKFRVELGEYATAKTGLEQRCDGLMRELQGTREHLRRAKVTLRGLHSERSRLVTQLAQASKKHLELLSDKGKTPTGGKPSVGALEVALQSMQVQIDGICSLREEVLGSRHEACGNTAADIKPER